ncbi:hypothetical protein PVK06_039247 [Gossypium arboreum]|uniref:Uncharacterized protein n=1 Tax=Gossypium arboreum TaxID=29729 RepID=A0ABR0N2X9_GOSAR|nr:hypothetical protein PVK06_039247 [Gossypium arboreum]
MMRPRPSTQNPINRRKLAHSGSHPPPKPDPGLDWSILLKPTSPSSSRWPEPKDPMVRPVSIEDQARFANMQIQNKIIDSCKEFFKNRVHDEENDDGDDDDFDEEEEKNEVDMFFMRIFVSNSELRGYYEENHEKCEFFCLVCGGIGENCINHEADTLQGEGSNKNVENLETGNSSGKVQKDASDSLVRVHLFTFSVSVFMDHLQCCDGSDHCMMVRLRSILQDKGDDLNVISGGVEFVNADGNGSVKKEVSSNDHSNGELMAYNMSNNSLEEDANENVESLEISDGELKSMIQSVKHEEMKEKGEFQTGIDVTATIGFLTSFEDIYSFGYVFVSRFLDADFFREREMEI